jgi:hypothetical protein
LVDINIADAQDPVLVDIHLAWLSAAIVARALREGMLGIVILHLTVSKLTAQAHGQTHMIISLGWQVKALADTLLVAEGISRTIEAVRLSALARGRTGTGTTETAGGIAATGRTGTLNTTSRTGGAHGCDEGSDAEVKCSPSVSMDSCVRCD